TAAAPDTTPATPDTTVATPAGTPVSPAGTPATPAGTPANGNGNANGNGAHGRQVSGTARPATTVTVYVRRPGHSAWQTLATVVSDTHGYWSATLPGNGRYEYYAQSANGQASAVLTVP